MLLQELAKWNALFFHIPKRRMEKLTWGDDVQVHLNKLDNPLNINLFYLSNQSLKSETRIQIF